MASYADWNQALIDYFTRGVANGERVYLSVDDDVLNRIGRKFNSLTYGDWRKDFCLAVRQELNVSTQLGTGDRIDLTKISTASFRHPPRCVAFLGITVLAAYDMASDTNASVDERNYYRRFRAALDLTTSEFNAPKGMISTRRIEPILWNRWSNWLQDHNFVPTALQGSSVTTRYIGYAISQSILRKADKEKIYKLVQEQGLVNNRNIDSWISYLRNNIQNLTPHLRALLAGTDDEQRLDVIRKAIQDTLDDQEASRFDNPPKVKPTYIRGESSDTLNLISPITEVDNTAYHHIKAEIYRTEDLFSSEYPNFYLHLRQKSGLDLSKIEIDSTPIPLQKSDLEGWYLPIFEHPIRPEELSLGKDYDLIRSSSHFMFDRLILARQDFWVLTPDPECLGSGIYASSFGRPALVQPFILLCRRQLIEIVEQLQNEQLLRFNNHVEAFENNSDWVEFQQCKILSEDWEGVNLGIEGNELRRALQPNNDVSISLIGGLWVPHLRSWLTDDVPTLTIFSSLVDRAEVMITNLSSVGQPVNRIVRTNTPINNIFERDRIVNVGKYEIQVTCGRKSSIKSVKLIDWKDLGIREPLRRQTLQIVNCNINGSHIRVMGN